MKLYSVQASHINETAKHTSFEILPILPWFQAFVFLLVLSALFFLAIHFNSRNTGTVRKNNMENQVSKGELQCKLQLTQTPTQTPAQTTINSASDVSKHDVIPNIATAKSEMNSLDAVHLYASVNSPFLHVPHTFFRLSNIFQHNHCSKDQASAEFSTLDFYGESAAVRMKKFVDIQCPLQHPKDNIHGFRSNRIILAALAYLIVNPSQNLKLDPKKESTIKR